MTKTWFITGASKGFGREWAIAALERGDNVAATARDPKTLDDLAERFGDRLLPQQLDVDDRAAVFETVRAAHDHFGGLDIVVNNAGYGQFGMIEELSEDEARRQFETNVFGALWVTQAALPFLREQGSGHILQVSSIGGVNAFPVLGLYHASKWGLEAFSQSLAAEVAEFGIKVTIVEPAGYSTDWRGPSSVQAEQLPIYDGVRDYRAKLFSGPLAEPGDPQATGSVILELVDADEPPLRVFLGSGTLDMIRAEYERRLENWERWDGLANAAQGGVAR